VSGSLDSILIFAQGYLEMGRNFRRGGAAFSFTKLVILFAALALVGVASWLLATFYRMSVCETCNHPGKLFRELCRAHELDRGSCRLLRQLAEQHNLEQPALVFVDTSLWNVTFEEAEQDRIAQLKTMLFAESSPAES